MESAEGGALLPDLASSSVPLPLRSKMARWSSSHLVRDPRRRRQDPIEGGHIGISTWGGARHRALRRRDLGGAEAAYCVSWIKASLMPA
uniref:Uncharacterized protein n=1 Tax=Arundo donax TaxID=35708 RepID=A0A0A9DPG3_ARUDO